MDEAPEYKAHVLDALRTPLEEGEVRLARADGTVCYPARFQLLLAANPDEYTELGRLQVCGNTWSHPAYADGKLYVRDGRSLQCLDLTSK